MKSKIFWYLKLYMFHLSSAKVSIRRLPTSSHFCSIPPELWKGHWVRIKFGLMCLSNLSLYDTA